MTITAKLGEELTVAELNRLTSAGVVSSAYSIARQTGIKSITISKWVSDHGLPHLRVGNPAVPKGNSIYINYLDLHRWLVETNRADDATKVLRAIEKIPALESLIPAQN